MSNVITPQYSHDCENCTFLGCAGGSDLYVCDGTLIVRASSEGSDNRTFSGCVIDALINRGDSVEGFLDKYYSDLPAMKACYLIAKMNGLVN